MQCAPEFEPYHGRCGLRGREFSELGRRGLHVAAAALRRPEQQDCSRVTGMRAQNLRGRAGGGRRIALQQ